MKKINLGALLALICLNFSATPAMSQDIKGSAVAGEKKNAMCIGCHGINGFHTGFPEVYRVPKISGQSAGYIEAALNAYRSGERKHPSMRTMASSLSAQDIADLSAYYASTGLTEASPAKAGNHSKGQALIEKGGCQSCHGPNLAKPIAPNYPVLAGQHADYIYQALRAYKTDNKTQIGRANPIMGPIAKQFSDAELKELSQYIEALPSNLVTRQPDRFR